MWGQVSPPLLKRWPIQTMESHPVLNRNALLSHEETQGRLTCILLSERSHPEIIPCDSDHRTFWKRWNYGDSDKISGCRGGG